MRKVSDIDDMVRDIEEEDNKSVKPPAEVESMHSEERVLIGTVEHFFEKIDVVAIKLVGRLKVGDKVEVEKGSSSIRFRVTSMQIDRKDVDSADDGDSVGIKVDNPIERGSEVYLLGRPSDI